MLDSAEQLLTAIQLGEASHLEFKEMIIAGEKLRVVCAKTENEVAILLGVERWQAKVWLARLIAEGVVEKSMRPVRCRVAAQQHGGRSDASRERGSS